jgi:hypothetical protein
LSIFLLLCHQMLSISQAIDQLVLRPVAFVLRKRFSNDNLTSL